MFCDLNHIYMVVLTYVSLLLGYTVIVVSPINLVYLFLAEYLNQLLPFSVLFIKIKFRSLQSYFYRIILYRAYRLSGIIRQFHLSLLMAITFTLTCKIQSFPLYYNTVALISYGRGHNITTHL